MNLSITCCSRAAILLCSSFWCSRDFCRTLSFKTRKVICAVEDGSGFTLCRTGYLQQELGRPPPLLLQSDVQTVQFGFHSVGPLRRHLSFIVHSVSACLGNPHKYCQLYQKKV